MNRGSIALLALALAACKPPTPGGVDASGDACDASGAKDDAAAVTGADATATAGLDASLSAGADASLEKGDAGSPLSGPVLRIDFEGDDFGAGKFADKSGHGNGADCQAAFALNSTTYDQCPSTTTGPNGSTAARFQGALCDVASDYLAISGSASLDGMSTGTMSVWISFDDNSVANLSEMILDTLQGGAPGTWELGRQGSPYLTFTAITDQNAVFDFFTFPGSHEPLHSWNHYAVTWDGTTVKGYYNGQLFGQATQQYVAKLKLGTYLTVGALNHGDPRNAVDHNCVNYYGADAALSYVQPNGDFLNGSLGEIRFYDRALSATEIASIASLATTPADTFVLSVTLDGTGVGAIQGADIDCGKHCTDAYAAGTAITLNATPQEGSTFTGWSGACSGTGSCSLTMNSHQSVNATFTRSYTVVASFAATDGTIKAPFVSSGGIVYQEILSSDPTQGGEADFAFTAPAAGDYLVTAVIDAPREADNSFFMNIDDQPVAADVWQITTTAGFQEEIVSWGGYSDGNNPPHPFTLTAGAHTVIFRGREGGTYLRHVYVLQR